MRGGSPAQNFPAFVVKMAALYALFADEGMGSAEPARSFRSYRDAFAEYSDDDFMIDEMKMKRLMKRQTHHRFLSLFFVFFRRSSNNSLSSFSMSMSSFSLSQKRSSRFTGHTRKWATRAYNTSRKITAGKHRLMTSGPKPKDAI